MDLVQVSLIIVSIKANSMVPKVEQPNEGPLFLMTKLEATGSTICWTFLIIVRTAMMTKKKMKTKTTTVTKMILKTTVTTFVNSNNSSSSNSIWVSHLPMAWVSMA
jgi:hypothetical protein